MRTRPTLVFVLAPVLAYLVVQLVVAAFVAKPPALGWIGLGVVSALALSIAAGAALLYPRSRANADHRHPVAGAPRRPLVVADAHCDAAELCRSLDAVGGRPAEVFVVAPVLPAPLTFLTDAEGPDDAQRRLGEMLDALERAGVEVRGEVGDDDPLQAIGDALVDFPATEIVLATPAGDRRSWLEVDLERQARDAYGLHVSSLQVREPVAAAVA